MPADGGYRLSVLANRQAFWSAENTAKDIIVAWYVYKKKP